ncbi:hypothetical protein [Janthinobacterium fluminis]|uniref:O-antigen ligase domain-containing protein n=1 Tax=Janthinobacterium fluminis TaxID=2987524 RepID=A0ABT5K345_9BURK|nr:hypothetical protein [Janthinobacterium fluminis]MDC8758875.1 hypothetical protein [Janthinobacterium fluminis]
MSVATATARGTPPPGGGRAGPPRRRNVALLLYLIISLLISMTISQEETPELGSLSYWLLVGAAGLLPFANAASVLRALLGHARPLLLFGLLGGAWHLAAGDMRAVLQLGLMVWVLAWLCCERVHVSTEDLVRLYVVLLAIGVAMWLTTDLNRWGILPATTAEEYGIWRVSFFPNIANTAILSLAMVLLLTRNAALARAHPVVLCIALYFVIFSFVRTALIALALYAAMRWWLGRRRRSAAGMCAAALLLAVGVNAALATSAYAIEYLQQFPLISRLFLRGESGLSVDEIFQQLYRPWLWWQHWNLFSTSPSLMGWGAFDFVDMQLEELNVGTTPAGNEALLTRLLATYGLPSLFFLYFLGARLHRAAKSRDLWACACFPPIILLMMQWGNIYHPTDANGSLFLLMLLHGSAAFAPARRRARRRAAAAPPRRAATDAGGSANMDGNSMAAGAATAAAPTQ